MAITITSATFLANTGLRRDKTIHTGWRRSSGDLIAIYEDLLVLERDLITELSKVNFSKRWQALLALSSKCYEYLHARELKGKNLASQKYLTIKQLQDQCTDQFVKEKRKADAMGETLRRNAASTDGVAMGRNNPGHAAVRFELVLKGALPHGTIVNGNTLWNRAVADGVVLTGRDAHDAFVLRAWLKKQVREKTFSSSGLKKLEYADETARQKYLLTFGTTSISQNNTPFNTTTGFCPGEEGAGCFVISPDGEWYAKSGNFIGGNFHHSSFLSGEPVMMAGTIRVAAGKLQYFSNQSGHYAPKLQDLVNGANAFRNAGFDKPTRYRASILFADFTNVFGAGGRGELYLFPYTSFVRRDGMVQNPANYRVFSGQGIPEVLFWTTPGAARPNHPAGLGVPERRGTPVLFP